MFKVLIADDEMIERNAFRLMINKNFSKLELVGEAANGIEAVEMARKYEPDIIVMDIKMPGIDGLKAIEEIKKLNRQTKFLVLTAYGNFEYAQRALKMGVEDYLLKPVKMQKFIETLDNVMQKINNETQQNEHTLYLKSRIESVKPYIEKDILSAVITGGDTTDVIKKYSSFIEMNLSNAFCMIINILDGLSGSSDQDSLNSFIEKQEVHGFIAETVKEIASCLIGQYFNDNIILLVPVEAGSDRYKNRLWSIDLANHIINRVRIKTRVRLSFGIGEVHNGCENIHNSYIEALKALKYGHKRSAITHYGDINVKHQQEFAYPYDLEKSICEKIVAGDTEESLVLLDKIIKVLIEAYDDNHRELKSKIYELVVVIQRCISENAHEACEFSITTGKAFEEVNSIKDLKHLRSWIMSYVRNLTGALEKGRQNKINSVIDSAIGYINTNFNKELTLEDVAYKVGISPYYLSKLFKQKLDKNFIDYIAELRISRAKELLKDTDKSIKEITYEVGYNSQTYFSKVFRKVSGISASEYKSSL